MAIDGDRVTATGTSAAILASAGPGAEVVDLRGRTVIPGLIDNHLHFVRAAEHVEVRLEGVRGRADALSALRRGAAELAPASGSSHSAAGTRSSGRGTGASSRWPSSTPSRAGGQRSSRRSTTTRSSTPPGSTPRGCLRTPSAARPDGSAAGWSRSTARRQGFYHAAFHWDHPASPPRPSSEDIEAAGDILRAAADGGWPVQTHSVTTRGLDLVFDAYERADRHRPIRPLRWSVTHAEGITAAHLERARRLGVTVQLRSQGVIRAARSAPAPLRLLCDSGLSWGLGTDGTRAAQVNPFVTLWWAETGRSLGGERTLDEPLTREEALIAHTRGNAQLMFRENDLGSIRPGLLADLLVLDRDYLTVTAGEIRDITPLATMVGGRVVHGSLASLLPCLHGNPAEWIGDPADRRAQLRGACHAERRRQPADFRHVDRPRR